MSHTLAMSFEYKTGRLSRWTYFWQASRQTLPMAPRHILRHAKVLKEVNASLLNSVQFEVEKCPQCDHEARSSSTLLKAFSQGKSSEELPSPP